MSSPFEVLPDVQFGLRWPDEEAGEDDRSLWAEKEARVFSAPRQSKAKAKGKARPKRGGIVVKGRLTAHSVLRALDHLLKSVYDGGLELFMQGEGDAEIAMQDRSTLVVVQDQGSPGFSMSWYVLYATKASAAHQAT